MLIVSSIALNVLAISVALSFVFFKLKKLSRFFLATAFFSLIILVLGAFVFEEAEKVNLQINTEPTEAAVRISYGGRNYDASTPISINVPKDSSIKFRFEKENYETTHQEITAEKNETIIVTLQQKKR